MKLEFNIGIRFIFGYAEEANLMGPVYAWQVSSEFDEYLKFLHDENLMKWGSRHSEYNLSQFKKFTKLKKL